MQVSQAIEEYRYAISSLSPKTQEWYIQKLGVFSRWCSQEQVALEGLRANHVRRFMDFLCNMAQPPLSTYTLHGYAQVIKGFLRWCAEEELPDLDSSTLQRVADRVELPKVDVKVIDVFTQDHIHRLLRACDQEYNGELRQRDRAIISMLLDTGIRAGELVGLRLEDTHLTVGSDSYLRVFGKGRKQREVGLGRTASAALHRYIARYRGRGAEGVVFLNRAGEPLTVDGLGQLIRRLGDWGRVSGVRCSPHTFRHTYAVRFLEAGGELYALSRLLGHSSVAVTENYLRAFQARAARKGGISVLDQLG
jgi:site-specific recombinase XerD